MAKIYEVALVIVTGFGPFLNHQKNISEQVVKIFSQKYSEQNILTAILPVSFSKIESCLRELHRQDTSQKILMFGLASGRQKIGLERVALNWIETEHADNDGYKPARGLISHQGQPVAYFSKLLLENWVTELNKINCPAEVSLSAGGYVCNYAYFAAHQIFTNYQLLFVHLPELLSDEDNIKAASRIYELMQD
jgi:pyroglutamyl-peptidase